MLKYQNVPVHYILSGMQRYVEEGAKPGSFLTAVLENNLRRAVENADDANTAALVDWVGFCYSELPSDIWGSPEKVAAHVEKCRLERESVRGSSCK